MKNTVINSYVDFSDLLIASVVSGPGRNEIQIIPLKPSISELKSNIEFESDEKVQEVKWISFDEPKNTGTPKKTKRKANDDNSFKNEENLKFDYLAILLTTGEMLIYSPLMKDFSNKISNDSPLSCICNGPKSTIIAYDSENSSLKTFNVFENRLQSSKPWKLDRDVKYMEYSASTNKLLVCSSTLYILNAENLEDESKVVSPKAHQSLINSLILSPQQPELLAVSRDSSSIIHIISTASAKITATLKTNSNIKTLILLPVSKSRDFESLAAITETGSIEIFVEPFSKKGRKQIVSNSQLITDVDNIAFVNIVNQDEYFKGIYYEDYNFDYTDFELDDLKNLQGQLTISLGREEAESDADPQSDDDAEVEMDESSELEDEEFAREEPSEVHTLISENLTQQSTLISIVSQNVEHSKRTTYLLSDSEAITLFKKISIHISDEPQQSANLAPWFKYLLLSKGNLISKDVDCIGVLKLVQSTLIENVKLLPNLLSLQGRLSLLQAQLKLRNEIMSQKHDTETLQNGSVASFPSKSVETSLVLDGENDDFEEDDLSHVNGTKNNDDDDDEDEDDEDEDIIGDGAQVELDGSFENDGQDDDDDTGDEN
ncbi:hypothetical protein CANARDRAFT_5906 [[Candida] arabinofermentans NRRL YB-2248]|uniref:Small-subunit processome Utp12 domain-containing protein n=1 Tax=[Candida] arabinofermentans NRRL YB-2248 TaxID=983967 RepID=A0A1E4T6H3_9ASCO|nr:hypothetical protein CANARDRAFT_5906 [[Candida] arabinofermentans NRRL YB-2248]